jgi:hypothetical protein
MQGRNGNCCKIILNPSTLKNSNNWRPQYALRLRQGRKFRQNHGVNYKKSPGDEGHPGNPGRENFLS